MKYAITFHPLALTEFKNASIWYEERRAGLSQQFEVAIEQKLEQIINNPLAFSFAKDVYRQAKVDVFPYVIVYKANKIKKLIFISAIYHTSRNSKGKFRK